MSNNKYEHSKIYKIVSLSNPDLVYYGSTIQSLSMRMASHRADMKKEKCICKSSIVIEKGDAVIMLVENFPCKSKEELLKKEGEYILNNNCVNKTVSGRTPKEYYEANKDKIKEYYQANKEKIKQQSKEYYRSNKEKHKE